MGYRAKLSDNLIVQPAVEVLANRLTPKQANKDFYGLTGTCPDCEAFKAANQWSDHSGIQAGLQRLQGRALDVHYTSAQLDGDTMLRSMCFSHYPSVDELCRVCSERKLAHHAAVVEVITEWASKAYPNCVVEAELQIVHAGAPPATFKPDICGYEKSTHKPVFCIEYQRSYETFVAFQKRHEIRHREFPEVHWYFDSAFYSRARNHRMFLADRDERFYTCWTDKATGQLIREDGAPPKEIQRVASAPKKFGCATEYSLIESQTTKEVLKPRPFLNKYMPMQVRGSRHPTPPRHRTSPNELIEQAHARGYRSTNLIHSFLKGSGVDMPISQLKKILKPETTSANNSDQLGLF